MYIDGSVRQLRGSKEQRSGAGIKLKTLLPHQNALQTGRYSWPSAARAQFENTHARKRLFLSSKNTYFNFFFDQKIFHGRPTNFFENWAGHILQAQRRVTTCCVGKKYSSRRVVSLPLTQV